MVTRRTERMVKKALMWGATGVLVLVALFVATNTYRVYTKMAEAREGRIHAEEERDQLVKRTEELSLALEALQTERGIESKIRERYPVVKPGEIEFVLVDKAQPAVDTSTPARESIWGSIKRWFGWGTRD